MVPGGGRGAEQPGGEARGAELDADRARHPGPLRQVLPPALVQSARPPSQAQALHWYRPFHCSSTLLFLAHEKCTKTETYPWPETFCICNI